MDCCMSAGGSRVIGSVRRLRDWRRLAFGKIELVPYLNTKDVNFVSFNHSSPLPEISSFESSQYSNVNCSKFISSGRLETETEVLSSFKFFGSSIAFSSFTLIALRIFRDGKVTMSKRTWDKFSPLHELIFSSRSP
ncbi:unnamed protein product [Linum trigynum]|uniref:Uncharacterized protein n=1 Tax=Linum trigynum TaxID=586398 RepID=A0AAV2G899_9ROSI